MPQVDLATLSAPELRRLLDTTRGRGDAALSYRILQEMAARREGRGRRGLLAARRPAEPRVVAVDLGDPLEPQDELPPMPRWRVPADRPAAAPEPETLPEAPETAVEDWDLRLRPAELEGLRAPRRSRWAAAGSALGVVLVFALGGSAGWFARDLLSPAAASAAAPVPIAAPAPPPATEPATLPLEVLPAETAPEPEPEPVAEAVPPPAPEAPPAMAEGCAAEPTPADRAICGDPELRRLQAELRRAYAEAMEAHEDRARLRERQLAWREARNAVTDPQRLARLYEQRIRRLDAAAAEARRARQASPSRTG